MTRGLFVAALAVGLAAAVYLARPVRLSVTGDEPHYLILADAIVHDRTLDCRNAYTRDATSHRIYDIPLTPHIAVVNHRWTLFHAPGLSLLVAIPFAMGGTVGAKLALCLLAGLLPLALYRFFADRLSPPTAGWLTAGIVLSLPFCFGATQVFPDLVAGTLATAFAVWLIRTEDTPRSRGAWALFWLGVGLLPWLNVKYLVTTAALVAWGVGAAWIQWWPLRHDRRRIDWPRCATVALVLAGPLGLAAFHVWAVGQPFGPRHLSEIASSFSRAAEMFLGLHFDQSQGMFIQQPLLLAGVAAFPIFARHRPGMAVFWLGLYASLIVPNSMELARWGGGGPVGRFSWSAEWLWAIPMGFAVAAKRTDLERWVKPVVIAALTYQVLLAVRWLPALQLLYPRLDEHLDARDSLFPTALRPFVPSFYFWDFSSYWTYGPNLVAYAVFLGLLLVGIMVAGRSGGRTSS